MLGAEWFRWVAERVLARSRADQTEVLVIAKDSALTRFANSAIHQNLVERDAEVRVRAVLGRQVGVATTNDLSEESLDRVVERAWAVARRQPENPDFPGLPDPSEVAPSNGFRSETAECSPERRAQMVKPICALAVEQDLESSGALATVSTEIGVANSRGVFVHDRFSHANVMTVVMGADGSGYAERTSQSIDAIDIEGVAREAVDRAARGRGPKEIPPGEYPVVLEEYAVGELLSFLAYMGFGALAYQEGHSFLRGKLGQRVMDERISIWDDGRDPRGLPMGFDFEGLPRQRVDIIREGTAVGLVYDSQTAAREGKRSTGHALPAPNTFGPFPIHLVMATGDTRKEELAPGIDRGLWVTRLHYVNVLQSDRAALTGMTRDGTFLIERGEVTYPVKSMRFTQSISEAWSDLGALGRELMLISSWGGGVLVPAMRLNRFALTGRTEE